LPAPKLPLSVTVKLEVAKQPPPNRPAFMEAAYALEEILEAVEQGRTELERLKKVKKPVNKVLEERVKKLEQDTQHKESEKKKLEERKKALKEQLEKLKEDKAKKDLEEAAAKKEKSRKAAERQKAKHDKLQADLEGLKVEFQAKRDQRVKEEEEKKRAKEGPPVDPAQKKLEVMEQLKQRKKDLRSEMKAQIEERKKAAEKEEASKARKEKSDKAKAEQIKKMYADTKEKAKELKERYREEYLQFKESEPVKRIFQAYDKGLYFLFDSYSRFDGVVKDGGQITMSYNAYMKMGQKLQLYPANVVSGADYIYVYKTMMKVKKQAEKEVKYETLQDVQGTKLNYNEFKEALLKIACLGKHKLYGGPQLSVDELKEQQAQQKKKQREALAGAAATGILKKKKGEGNEDGLVE
jgi:chemotaxis protein histidine kinase CheA